MNKMIGEKKTFSVGESNVNSNFATSRIPLFS